MILDALWGTDYVAESNVVDRQIRNLRIKLQSSWRRPGWATGLSPASAPETGAADISTDGRVDLSVNPNL